LTSQDLQSIDNNTPNYAGQGETSCSTVSGLSEDQLPEGVPTFYSQIISSASQKFGSDPNLEAAILYWENRGFPSPSQQWAVSSAGAKGPMQFLQGTFDAYAVDGDGDGKTDILNVYDSLFTAAKMLAANGGKAGTPLGDLGTPLAPNTLLRVAASYNWGGGNVKDAGENATLDDLPTETSDYLKAVYILISSNFSESPISGSETVPDNINDPAGSGISDECSTNPVTAVNGSGKFIDNTSEQIPGAAQAVAKAQEIAKYSLSQLQSICDGSPNCYQRCERLAGVVWGRTSSGYSTANEHWSAAKSAGKAHPGDRNVPVGALLYYDTGSSSGHVATYLGNNTILSNDVNDPPGVNRGGAYMVPATSMETGPWKLKYLGWVSPVPW
jgi:hypothetical protein